MNKLITLLTALLPLATFSQLINKGGDIYTQKGALIHQQGAFINGNGATVNGSIKNDGIIEVDGDFENAADATFGVHSNTASTDRAVKFTGAGTQAIKGNMSSSNSSFYNLVIDKAAATDAVEMQTSVNVHGSLIFGTATTTTYSPSALYTNNNQKGLVKTYTDTDEFTIAVTNGDVNAIAGYPSLVINGAPVTAYILTKGNRGSANGGLQRKVTDATAYVFPIGTTANGFNAVRMNFTNVPVGGGNVIGKFNDGTDAANGAAGTIAMQYDAYNGNGYVNPGYNRLFPANPCNNNAPQWLILEDAVVGHGYWSFASDTNNRDYSYMVETFPNSFNNSGITSSDVIRTVKYDAAYGFNPSAATWNSFIDSVSSLTDLLTYSKNTGSCYTEDGIPGGIYTGLAHFSLKGARTSNALPVELLSLKAEPKQSTIEVSWATSLELNNRGFEVKRSEDGMNFTTIGWVDGNNNSTVELNYAFTDNQVRANTVYYYRLNQIDNDGANEESFIVSAVISAGGTDVVVSDPMPNPAHNASSLVVTTAVSQSVTVKLYDIIGQVVSADAYTLQAGDNTLPLNIQGFAAGTYNAVLYTADKTFSKKMIVSNN